MRILTLLLFIVFSLSFSAQETVGFKKNIVYVNGLFGGVLNYERVILETESPIFKSLNIHVGIGRELDFFGGTMDVAHISILGMTGKNNNHIIYGFGLRGVDLINETWYNINMSNYYYDLKNGSEPQEKPIRYRTFPAFRLGYRYLKPGGRFMFNAGIGSPELIFVGAGFTF